MKIAYFKRGRDKKPRKRRNSSLLPALGSGFNYGITAAGIGATGGLIVRPNATKLQANLARIGLLSGVGYGAYKSFKQEKKRRFFNP